MNLYCKQTVPDNHEGLTMSVTQWANHRATFCLNKYGSFLDALSMGLGKLLGFFLVGIAAMGGYHKKL